MSRVAIVSPRIAVPGLVKGLPSWLKGRASIYDDGTDDRVTGTIPVDMAGAGAFTIRARLRPASRPALTDRGAVSFGTNLANQGAFLGSVVAGGKRYLGGGLIGNTLADVVESELCQWTPCMLRVVGGVGGAMTFVAKDRAQNTVASPNIVGSVAELGRLLAAGSCFHGQFADVLIDSRAISDAEYDDWRKNIAVPTAPRRHWSCENPGYGTTCTEEIGKTADAMTGAVWDPVVPFRRMRVVEDVPYAVGPTNATVPHSAAVDPEAGSWGVGLWFHVDQWGATFGYLAQKDAGGVGYYFAFSSNVLILRLRDGAVTITDSSTLRCADGQWHSAWLVVDRSLGLALWYLDARRPRTIALGALASLSCPAGVLQLGAAGSVPVSGRNDYAWVKGRAPTWDEIEAFHFEGRSPTDAICWPMREAAGTTAISIPAGYDATLVAASHVTSTRCHARTAA